MSNDADERLPNYLQVLTRVMGLAIACPYGQDNPEHCQLCEVRSLPLSDRIEWVRDLSAAELQRIAVGHDICLKALESLSRRSGERSEGT